MASTKRRSSSRTASASASAAASSGNAAAANGAKSSKPSASNAKKRKLNSAVKTKPLVDFLTDFNLTINELFQLKEYGSVVDWNPADFSPLNPEKPPLFEDFTKQPQYTLQWLEQSESELHLDDLPHRLQKKVLAEREQKILSQYPFKDQVLGAAQEAENQIFSQLVDPAPTVVKQEPARREPRPPKPAARKVKQEEVELEESSESSDSDDEEIDITDFHTNIKRIKSVRFGVPEPVVTHPSHIPLWTPPKADTMGEEEDSKIIPFDSTPIELKAFEDHWDVAVDLEKKLQNFLDNKMKFAIIDEATTADCNNTKEEYDKIMDEQLNMMKLLYQKTAIDKSLILHGDKVEKRKIVLPQPQNTVRQQDPFRDTQSIIPKIYGPSSASHIDSLLSQGMAFSKIHQQVRRQRLARTRKIALMIDQHFKWKRGEKERIAREREQNLKRIGRLAMQAVKKRWSQAYKVYKYIQDQKEEELKKIKGREHLSHMLEHSTQLLEAQLGTSTQGETSQSDDPDSRSNTDDNLSTSESEVEDDDEDNLDGDNDLSVEKLKEKYQNMEETPVEDSDDDLESDRQGLSALYNDDVVSSEANITDGEDLLKYTDEQQKLIETFDQEGSANPVLDEKSDSDSSISDEESSEEEGSGYSESQEVSDADAAEPNGLASLFSNGDAAESADESADGADGSNVSEDDNMSLTDDEDEPKTPKSEMLSVREKNEDLPEQEVNGSKVKDVPLPSLLRGTLRPYQKQGLNWLASLYSNDTNGILADEMGLGKTIQTISLLAHLADEYHIWGPHLIIVPTSVMLNWEMEFKKFAPGFKVMTYYGSPQQRAQKRKGWNKVDAFHVCITSYQLVVHDNQSFKRRRWRYMILDEAHNIKNFRSTRWKALLNFNTENRLLLTGTPLQNNLMELWSLLYFLMPSSKVNQAMPDGFANLEDFQTWFGKPVDSILEQASHKAGDLIDENESTVKGMDEETRNTVARLHQVLRPYILRRLKKDVEKQMPGKYEHIIYCRLSQRQRYLYDDFMSRAKTKETLASGNFLSIINCLMQLRKVCNHPDLFEVRPIVTSLAIPNSVPGRFEGMNSLVMKLLHDKPDESLSLETLNLDLTSREDMDIFPCESTKKLCTSYMLQKQVDKLNELVNVKTNTEDANILLKYHTQEKRNKQISLKEQLEQAIYLNNLRCERRPLYGPSFLKMIKGATTYNRPIRTTYDEIVLNLDERVEKMNDIVEQYSVLTPKALTLDITDSVFTPALKEMIRSEVFEGKIENPLHKSQVKLSIAFPDKTLLQYDCGKLQKLDKLLHQLTSEGHRALIFTQMTKVLDILEQFLNIHGYRYMRLDGSTKIEDRQLLTEQFNRDDRIPVFILSSRSGGLGINLTGADTVIFYDSDWNPAMDKQCQDRCHRIGQMRDVHIYRFVSEHTIESNILRKANQKRQLDNVVIQEGDFTTDYFGKFSVRDLVNDTSIVNDVPDKPLLNSGANLENVLMQAEDEEDRSAANAAMKEVQVDDDDFNEEITGSNSQTPNPEPKEENADQDFDDGVGHIDEYMLRSIANGYYVE